MNTQDASSARAPDADGDSEADTGGTPDRTRSPRDGTRPSLIAATGTGAVIGAVVAEIEAEETPSATGHVHEAGPTSNSATADTAEPDLAPPDAASAANGAGTGASDGMKAGPSTTDTPSAGAELTPGATGEAIRRSPGGGSARGGDQGGKAPGADAGAAGRGALGSGRMLGTGAVAGLGAAATAGLLTGGHTEAGGTGGHGPGTAHASHGLAGHTPTAFTPNSSGDQGYTPHVPAAVTGQPTATAPNADGGPSSLQPVDDGSSGTVTPHVTHTPAATVPQGTTSAHHTVGRSVGTPSPAHPSGPAGQGIAGSDPAQAGQGSTLSPVQQQTGYGPGAVTDPSGSGTASAQQPAQPMLYDSSGHPAMAADQSGQWHPVTGASGAAPTVSSPVLYDSSGHPAAMTDSAGHVIPIAASGQLPTTSGSGDHAAQPPSSIAPTAQDGSPQTQVDYEWVEIEVPMNNAQIAEYMRKATPEERQAQIQKVLDKNKIEIPGGVKNWAQLPPNFFDKDTYGYEYTDAKGDHKVQLDSITAAATVIALNADFAQLRSDVGALSSTAAKLESKTSDITSPAVALALALNDVDSMWDTLGADINDMSDIKLAQSRNIFEGMRQSLFGGAVDNPAGNISSVAAGLCDEAKTLRLAVSAYVQMESDNLSWFGIKPDDPRSAWEKANYVNGQDLTRENIPDPLEPCNSPYYEPPK